VSFLLDTDTCSVHLKRSAGLTSRLVQHAGRLHVSILTVGELLTWAKRRDAPPRRLAGIEDFLGEVDTLQICKKVAEVFAELRAGQLDTGNLTPSTDLWIAATAIAHGLTLVTHNTRDYKQVPGLSLADWVAP
jgi:tRNA(fMet)-specific endonuclease VapC